MQADYPMPNGLWLPLVTSFRNGALDEASETIRCYGAGVTQ